MTHRGIMIAGVVVGVSTALALLATLAGRVEGIGADAAIAERLLFAAKCMLLAGFPLLLWKNVSPQSALVEAPADRTRSVVINGLAVHRGLARYLFFVGAGLAAAAGTAGDKLGLIAAGSLVFVVTRLVFETRIGHPLFYQAADDAATACISFILLGTAAFPALLG